jgi:hypothetical protein
MNPRIIVYGLATVLVLTFIVGIVALRFVWRQRPRVLQLYPSSSLGDEQIKRFNDASQAISSPDEYAWRLFAQINIRAGDATHSCGDEVKAQPRDSSNDACWERWADATGTTPEHTREIDDVYTRNNCSTIVWPQHGPLKSLSLSLPILKTLNDERLRNPANVTESEASALQILNHVTPGGGISGEEVRMNRVAFTYIADNQLWYRQGLAKFVALQPVDFPLGSIEIKASWKLLCGAREPCPQRASYHWQTNTNNEVYGVVSLNIMEKLTSDWMWMTWEHESNIQTACSFSPCSDRFGYRESGNGAASEDLQELFCDSGMTTEWRHYRLHGTQLALDKPPQLTNLILEATDEESSCMFCHAAARVDQAGFPQSTPRGKALTLIPERWFIDSSGQRRYWPLDFVWSLMRTRDRKSARGCPPNNN